MADPINLPDGFEVVTELTPATFDYTGAAQTWAVPNDEPGLVLFVNIEGRGARGGLCGSSHPEEQRQFKSTTISTSDGTALSPGHPLRGTDTGVQVGGDGLFGSVGSHGVGGWPNGGRGGDSVGANESGGGGGGATKVEGFDWSIGGTGGASGAPNIGIVEPPILVFDPGLPGYVPGLGDTHARSVHGGVTFVGESPDNVATIIDFDFPDSEGLGYSQGEDGGPGTGGRGGGFSPFLGVLGEDGGADTGQGGQGADAEEYIEPVTSTNLGGVAGGGGGGGGGGDADQGGGGGGAGSSNGDGTYDVFGQTPVELASSLTDLDHYPQGYAWRMGWGGGGDGYGFTTNQVELVCGDDTEANGQVVISAWWLRPTSDSGMRVDTLVIPTTGPGF